MPQQECNESPPFLCRGSKNCTYGGKGLPQSGRQHVFGVLVFCSSPSSATPLYRSPSDSRARFRNPARIKSGQNIFATANYHAEFSKDNGKTWQGLDPFTIFGEGFCCDQATVYDAAHDRQHWALQYLPSLVTPGVTDHLILASSAGRDFIN